MVGIILSRVEQVVKNYAFVAIDINVNMVLSIIRRDDLEEITHLSDVDKWY